MATKVHVVDRKGRGLVLRWHDPITGKLREKVAGMKDRREAERFASDEAAKLGRSDGSSMTWREFRERFDAERLPMLSPGSQETYGVTFKLFEKWAASLPLKAISSSVLSRFAVELRIGRREITVMKHLRQLRAALHWAYSLELIDRMPSIPKPARGVIIRKMKGKPLSAEEFDLFLAAIPSVVPAEDVAAWEFFARGLWWQGLRVGEALELWWDREDRHRVDLERQYPLIWIRGHLEKGKKDRPHPLAPQFAELLRSVPKELRTDRCSNWQRETHTRRRMYGPRCREWEAGLGRQRESSCRRTPPQVTRSTPAFTTFGDPVHCDGRDRLCRKS